MHLNKMLTFSGRPGPLLLVVMDGVGLAPPGPGNAVALARTPVLDKLIASDYHTALHAHGTHVGLSTDQEMGNSEVGHNTLGGGRIFVQGAKLVQQALQDGAIFTSEPWGEVESRGQRGNTVHFIGLLSDGNVHAHIEHLFALLARCQQGGLRSVCIHALLDGRDVAPRSALHYIHLLEAKLAEINRAAGCNYRIASGGGRMVITMDRYQADWRMVKRGFDAHVHGIGCAVCSAGEEIQRQYDADANLNDQFLQPFVVTDEHGNAVGAMQHGDAVVLFNFRGDRAIEISRAFEEAQFAEFERGNMPDLFFCGLLQYDGDLHIPKHYLVKRPQIERTMVEFLCAEKLKSFAVSETQKFGHVTYFWNGNRSGYFAQNLETWVEIPSHVGEFQRAPAMKAAQITDTTIELLRSGQYRFGRINFANGDMVGHSGDIAATVRAVEAVDQSLARLLEVITECGGVAIITADHGNADEMLVEQNGTQTVRTAHSLNAVPCAIFDPQLQAETQPTYQLTSLEQPGLANVAATVFNLLGYHAPPDYMPSLLHFAAEPISRRSIHRGSVVDVGLETVQLPNREILALEIIRHRGGAVVVACNAAHYLALLRQFRHAAGGWIWEFPAGTLEDGETPQQTAVRELREEAGCRADTWQCLGSTLPAPGFCSERLHLFLATGLHSVQAEPQPHEFIEIHWKPVGEIVDMAQRGEINDAKSIVALFRVMSQLTLK